MPWELYNLQADPRETTDLVAREKQVFLTLDAAMRRHIQQGGQVPWEPEDPAAGVPASHFSNQSAFEEVARKVSRGGPQP